MSNNYTILLVEDYPADAAIATRRILSLWPSCHVKKVSNVSDALCEIDQSMFDLILLDLNLPDSSGARTVYDIRRANDVVPIIAVTGLLTDFILDDCMRLGANYILEKSKVMDDHFFDILNTHVGVPH